MEVWKISFLSKWVICRFHVNLPGCMMCLVVHTVHRKKTHAPLNMISIHTYLSYHISNDSYRVLCVNRVYIHSWCSSQKSIDEIDATPVDMVNTPSFRAKIMIFHQPRFPSNEKILPKPQLPFWVSFLGWFSLEPSLPAIRKALTSSGSSGSSASPAALGQGVMDP